MYPDIAKKIPSYVHDILIRLAENGKQGYLVGGSLRDILRGVVPHDFDLTASATPDEMLMLFKDYRTIPTGLAHGTVTVMAAGNPVEITTHRTDGAYTDSRHPDSVRFTDCIEEDLARRDFTVNAMAWNDTRGLIDPFGGARDLACGILRAVGNPHTRFTEDALRILRLFRFAAGLDFSIEEETRQAAAACAAGLSDISVERILAELSRTVTAPAAAKGLRALLDAGTAPYVFFDCTIDEAALEALDKLPENAPLRLAALLHQNTPDKLEALAKRWHASNVFTRALTAAVKALRLPIPESPYAARRFVCTQYPHFADGLLLRAALWGEDTSSALDLCRRVLADGTAVEIRRLAVNGRELQDALGVRPAKTGKLLARLQELVWEEPARNRREALLALARNILEKEKDFYE
ncbi:MAG: polynucleotide adenylyltransferase [Clostridia bacterium]|nr:polynucleotide adenylyltransferase [Clostridia bacterium]